MAEENKTPRLFVPFTAAGRIRGQTDHSMYISPLRGPSGPFAGGPDGTFQTNLGPLGKGRGESS